MSWRDMALDAGATGAEADQMAAALEQEQRAEHERQQEARDDDRCESCGMQGRLGVDLEDSHGPVLCTDFDGCQRREHAGDVL